MKPNDDGEFQEFIDGMTCGVEFLDEVKLVVAWRKEKKWENSIVQKIVRQYGLLEPNPRTYLELAKSPEVCGGVSDLFIMTPAQQLVALYMMLGSSDDCDFGDVYWIGFKELSTYVAKSAIAAALVMRDDDDGSSRPRPTLQEVLMKIGFRKDLKATNSDLSNKWDSFDRYEIVNHVFLDDEEHTNSREMGSTLFEASGVLHICKRAEKELLSMTVASELDKPDMPSAWKNTHCSAYPDSFVTFYCKQDDCFNPIKFTLMIQAKDYHNKSQLNFPKLEKHSKRCEDSILDNVFGKDRLLCVAGSDKKIIAKNKRNGKNKRSFIPYAVNRSKLLQGLLSTLENQRNRKIMDEKNGKKSV